MATSGMVEVKAGKLLDLLDAIAFTEHRIAELSTWKVISPSGKVMPLLDLFISPNQRIEKASAYFYEESLREAIETAEVR